MAQTALGGLNHVLIGHAGRQLNPSLAAFAATTLDATLESVCMYGRVVTEDGGSHTIDTTGSSSLGWRTGTSTFANAGTVFNVGLATIDAAVGPPARATNVADLITFNVSKSMTGGGGGITSAAWQEHVPDTGTQTIAHGDYIAFCVQAVTRAGADSVLVAAMPDAITASLPGITGFTGGTYTRVARQPNFVITFSDGTYGFLAGSFLASIGLTAQSWANNSAKVEYGNYIKCPVPLTIYGIGCTNSAGGNLDLVLYSDPLGTPVAERTVSIDLNTVGVSAADMTIYVPFTSPYVSTANQELAAIMTPTSTTAVIANYLTVNVANHLKAHSLGTNSYAINRASGAFAAQNSSKDRFGIGLLVSALDDGAGGGSSGMLVHPGMQGGIRA